MNDFMFNGKVALVTGANRGIGEAFVHELMSQGVGKVYAGARDLSNLDNLKMTYGDRLYPLLLDVTNKDHIATLPQLVDQLDILVNNAGIINPCSSTSDQAVEIARLEMETNFFGPMQVTQQLLPLLRQSAEAAIINISSIAGISNFPSIGPYSATKAAFHSYTQGLRADLAGDGIRVVGVYPGPIDTRMTAGWEMEKPAPIQVAQRTVEALVNNERDVMPDSFSEQMYSAFLRHPHELEKAFAEMQ